MGAEFLDLSAAQGKGIADLVREGLGGGGGSPGLSRTQLKGACRAE
jgi:hypothetical protein